MHTQATWQHYVFPRDDKAILKHVYSWFTYERGMRDNSQARRLGSRVVAKVGAHVGRGSTQNDGAAFHATVVTNNSVSKYHVIKPDALVCSLQASRPMPQRCDVCSKQGCMSHEVHAVCETQYHMHMSRPGSGTLPVHQGLVNTDTACTDT
jgi:hypothetical protein